MKKLLFGAVAIVCAAASPAALAWHAQGHMIVADLAWSKLKPGVRCAAFKLLSSNDTFADFYAPITKADGVDPKEALFMHAATWPDRIKLAPKSPSPSDLKFTKERDVAPAQNTAAGKLANVNGGLKDPVLEHNYWHFIDYPVPADPSHPPGWANAEKEIGLLAADLKSTKTSLDQKAAALAWLIHLVGDVHQPLHAAEQWSGDFAAKGDAGGNDVYICPTGAASCEMAVLCPPDSKKRCEVKNLHTFWDAIPGDGYEVSSAKAYIAKYLPKGAASDASTDAHAWAMASNALAVSDVYITPVTLGVGKTAFTMTDTYKANAKKKVDQQLPLAGARLANVLNASLAPDNSCGV